MNKLGTIILVELLARGDLWPL